MSGVVRGIDVLYAKCRRKSAMKIWYYWINSVLFPFPFIQYTTKGRWFTIISNKLLNHAIWTMVYRISIWYLQKLCGLRYDFSSLDVHFRCIYNTHATHNSIHIFMYFITSQLYIYFYSHTTNTLPDAVGTMLFLYLC